MSHTKEMQIGLVTHYVETARRFALNSKKLGEKARDSQPVAAVNFQLQKA